MFKLKEKIVGQKSKPTEAVAIDDPITGNKVSSANGIIQASLDYCSKLLTIREPTEEFADDIERKREVHASRMIEDVDDEFENFNEA